MERRVTSLCELVDYRSCRIGEAEHLACFVESFSRGIIKCPANDIVREVLSYNREQGMPSGNRQRDK